MARIIAIAAPILILAGLGVGGTVVLSKLKPEPEKADEAPAGLNVFAEKIREGNLEIEVKAQGEVRPKREIVVAPQISGRISYVSPDFIDGGFIKQGQLLVKVEAADYELAVVRAQSSVASAQQALARETAKVSAAAEAISPVRRGIVAGVINFVATLFVITGGLDELYLDPELGFVAGPALAWLLIAVPGGLVASFGRTFVMIFYGLLAAAVTVGVVEIAGGAAMASIAGWFILSLGAIRAYYGENATLKAIAVTLGIFIFTGGQAIFMPNGGLALQVGVFWGVHALLEKMTVSKQPA